MIPFFVKHIPHGSTYGGHIFPNLSAYFRLLSSTNNVENFLQIGDKLSLTKCFIKSEIEIFLTITGDSNPLHSDAKTAADAGFSGVVVPGILMASLFPAIIGSTFPGAVYVSQTLRFRSPALEGQMLHAEVEVSKSSRAGGAAGPWVTFKTCCRSEDGTILVDGEALSRMPSGVIVRPIL